MKCKQEEGFYVIKYDPFALCSEINDGIPIDLYLTDSEGQNISHQTESKYK